jgi:hypothetical protein
MAETLREYEKRHGVEMALLCFALFSWLIFKDVYTNIRFLVVLVVLGTFCSFLYMHLLGSVLSLCNPNLRSHYGFRGVKQQINTAYIGVIPFTVLAVISQLLLKWQSGQVFLSAGIMAAGTLAVVELSKAGGGKIKNGLLCGSLSFAFSLLWIVLTAMAGKLGGILNW